MPNTRAIKRRIRSVSSTQQITRAMKMVAAAKLRRAQERLVRIRPYADALNRMLGRMLPYTIGDEHPLLVERPVKRVCLLLVTSDKGLCGGFNANLFRAAVRFVQEHRDTDPAMVTVGRKGQQYFSRRGYTIVQSFRDLYDDLTMHDAETVASDVVERFLAEEFDEVYVLYSRFVSAITQKQELVKMLPLDRSRHVHPETPVLPSADRPEKPWDEEIPLPDVIFEPDLPELVPALVQQIQSTELYRYFLESISSEFAARMTAMESATSNAGDMIDRLTLKLNRARQAAITTELSEIVAGADAIQG